GRWTRTRRSRRSLVLTLLVPHAAAAPTMLAKARIALRSGTRRVMIVGEALEDDGLAKLETTDLARIRAKAHLQRSWLRSWYFYITAMVINTSVPSPALQVGMPPNGSRGLVDLTSWL